MDAANTKTPSVLEEAIIKLENVAKNLLVLDEGVQVVVDLVVFSEPREVATKSPDEAACKNSYTERISSATLRIENASNSIHKEINRL